MGLLPYQGKMKIRGVMAGPEQPVDGLACGLLKIASHFRTGATGSATTAIFLEDCIEGISLTPAMRPVAVVEISPFLRVSCLNQHHP